MHPTVNKLVQGFRLEQQHTDVLLAQLRAGDEYPRRKSEVVKDEKIKSHVELWGRDYCLENLFEFLDTLILIIDN